MLVVQAPYYADVLCTVKPAGSAPSGVIIILAAWFQQLMH